ncbi:MAG: patatin-like phospholipase family protein [Thermonemataceae bacterium]
MTKTTKTALVLQGGGALGAYQYGAISAIEEAQPDFEPCIVTGVSIGAINAAVYVGGREGGVKSLKRLWDTVKMPTIPFLPQQWQAKASKVANPAMYYMSTSYLMTPLVAESVYDLAPFKQLLNDLIDFDKINQSKIRLVIEAVNVETGELKQFKNHDEEGIDLDKVVSSMSIPPNFPMVAVDNNYYWDGGLYANMPLAPAINYLEDVETKKVEKVVRELIIMNLFRKNSPLPTNIMEISDRIKEIMFESKLKLDRKFFEQMKGYIEMMQAVDKELPKNSPVRKMKAYQELLNHKIIDRHGVLQYEAEGVEGTDDFTPEAIDFRFRRGYRDMQNYLHLSTQNSN